MNPYQTYQQQHSFAWTRIDMLLALNDGAIERLETARDALARNDSRTAVPLLLRSLRIVAELLAGVDLRYGELPRNLQRLYVFVLTCISRGAINDIEPALRVLRILREGLEQIQPEAQQLERDGSIPPLSERHAVSATA